LIGTLAMVAIWLVGLAAKARDWMRRFQANTEKKKPVLSIFFLGNRLIRNHRLQLERNDLVWALKQLPLVAHDQVKFVGID